MFKACIFDLDGTLTDTLDSLEYSVNRVLGEMELPEISRDQCRAFVGNGARRLMEQALDVSGDHKLWRIEEAMERYGRIFAVYCTYHVKPYDGIVSLLEELKKRGIQSGVLSNKPHLQTVHVAETIFGKGVFAYIQGQCEEIPRKPDPAGIELLTEQMGVTAKECLYIGDSEVDMMTGNAARMETVGVEWGFRSKDILTRFGAKYTIDRPEKLLEILSEQE